MIRRLTGYDYENIEVLKATKKPFAIKVATLIADTDISKVNIIRGMVQAVVELESLKELYGKELAKLTGTRPMSEHYGPTDNFGGQDVY